MASRGLGPDEYLLAVAFGNAHGTAVVPDLKPALLTEIADKTGQCNMFVFHGGSGSPDADVRAAVANGVVKMNVDTDTQYAYTNGVMDYMMLAPVVGASQTPAWKSHKEGKKWFDPRKWDAAGRVSMSVHVHEVARLLGSNGRAAEELVES